MKEGTANTYQKYVEGEIIKSEFFRSNEWLALGHYRKKYFSHKYISEADDPDFFYSDNGVYDPQLELTATIAAFFKPAEMNDEHPQCKHPARFKWLKNKIPLDIAQLPAPECKRLNEWVENLRGKKVVLVFANNYLNNPSSMFGHTFLRFDIVDSSNESFLMAPSVNFAANIEKREGLLQYIYKGLFGGFPSSNPIEPFYHKLRTYSDYENRDIWEYQLNLTPDQIDTIILHLWELKDGTFDYYFLDENCSYRVMSLLAAALPEINLLDDYIVYTIPVDTIKLLEKHGLINSKTYRPSELNSFLFHIKELNDYETSLVVDLVQNGLPIDSPSVTNLPADRKALVLKLSSEYLDILVNKDVIDRSMSAKLTHDLIVERSKFPMPVMFYNEPTVPNSPDEGHDTHLLNIGIGSSEDDIFYSMGYRAGFHALLDPIQGFEKGAHVEFFNFELRADNESNIKVDKLDILNITSISPSNIFFNTSSFNFAIGGKRKLIDNQYPFINYLEFEKGHTYSIGKTNLSGMLHFSLNVDNDIQECYDLGIGIKPFLTYQSSKFSYDIGGLVTKYIFGNVSSLSEIWGKFGYSISSKNTVYLDMRYSSNKRNNMYEISFGLWHYF
ncbi:MAG: DUF4105 domain-containing protein [Deltaproteobacteria bacterium]|nr:DUF4105 domain-containing protein [Deltaproteobacteria bacterium]